MNRAATPRGAHGARSTRLGTVALSIERVERLDEETANAVREMVERTAVHERHSPIGEHKFVRLREGESDTFGLVVRTDAYEIAGYAHATHYPALGRVPERLAAELVVDPSHRGRGIGTLLARCLLEEARQKRVARFDLWGHHADAGCSVLADALGMHVSRSLWQLSLRLDSVPVRRRRDPTPEGVRLRTFAAGDEDRVVELIRAAFPEHPENASWTREDFDQHAALAWFDPTALLLAEGEDGGLLGLHWMKLEGELPGGEVPAGEVYMLGVAPGVQGHGLGKFLLLEGLGEMRRRGVTLAFLYVDAENDAAMRLYRQVGFRHEHLDTCFSLDLETVTGRRGPSAPPRTARPRRQPAAG